MRLRLTSHGKERRLKSLGRRVVRHLSVRRVPCDVSRRSMSRCSIRLILSAYHGETHGENSCVKSEGGKEAPL